MRRKSQNNANPKSRHLKCARTKKHYKAKHSRRSLCLVAENIQDNILEWETHGLKAAVIRFSSLRNVTWPHGAGIVRKKEFRILNEDVELNGHGGVCPCFWQIWLKSETLDFTRSIRIYKFYSPYSTPINNLPIINNSQLFSSNIPSTLHTLS